MGKIIEMRELRRHPRKLPSNRIVIHDRSQQQPLGNLVNISSSGLMLMTDRELLPGHIFQLEMSLPLAAGGVQTIAFGAETLWCQSSPPSEQCWVGFQIIDMAESDTALIEQLTDDWKM